MQIRIHKTCHGPNLGETTTFPLIVYFVLQFLYGSPEIPKVGTPTTLGPHNFPRKPPIGMRVKENL